MTGKGGGAPKSPHVVIEHDIDDLNNLQENSKTKEEITQKTFKFQENEELPSPLEEYETPKLEKFVIPE